MAWPAAVSKWGTTAAERERPYPCDGLIEGPAIELYRGIDVEAPQAVTFRWLCQLRAAPYSYDKLDNLGGRSPQELTPGLEELRSGPLRWLERALLPPGDLVMMRRQLLNLKELAEWSATS
jgi:hypothetical protein